MPVIQFNNPVYQTVGNVAYSLERLASSNREELASLLSSHTESPTDAVGNFRIGAIILKAFEFDGLVTFAICQKFNPADNEEELQTLLKQELKIRLRELYSICGLDSPCGREPFQTALRLAKVRNSIVHPQVLTGSVDVAEVTQATLFSAIDGFFGELANATRFTELCQRYREAQETLINECELQLTLPSSSVIE
jgi:hypothetical protein